MGHRSFVHEMLFIRQLKIQSKPAIWLHSCESICVILFSCWNLHFMGLTSGRRHRICQTTSAFYSVFRLYCTVGHCFPLFTVLSLCLFFCKFCAFYLKYEPEKIPRAEHASKQLSVKLWNVPTFWNLQVLKSLLGPKSSTDATSNEVLRFRMLNTTNTLFRRTLLHTFGKNTRICSPTARSIHCLHCFHHQLHRRHVLAQSDKVQALPCLCWRGWEDPPPGAISFAEPTLPDRSSR